MPTYLKYHDPITLEHLNITDTTILYVTKIARGEYTIQGVSSNIASFRFNPHLCNTKATTRADSLFSDSRDSVNATRYWKISDPLDFIAHIEKNGLKSMVFRHNRLSTHRFSLKEIIKIVQFNPEATRPSTFNQTANAANTKEWEREQLTENYLMVSIASHFSACITDNDYTMIKEAVDALYAVKKGTSLSEEHCHALSRLDIPRATQEQFIEELTSGALAFNAPFRAKIEAYFTLDKYPTHAARYFIQTNLAQLVENNKPSENSFDTIMSILNAHPVPTQALVYENEAEISEEDPIQEILQQALFEFVHEEFKLKITAENHQDLTDGWETLQETTIPPSPNTRDLFRQLDISDVQIEIFRQRIIDTYSFAFETEALQQQYMPVVFDPLVRADARTHVETLGEFAMFGDLLTNQAPAIIRGP